jgi:hypothetical protein
MPCKNVRKRMYARAARAPPQTNLPQFQPHDIVQSLNPEEAQLLPDRVSRQAGEWWLRLTCIVNQRIQTASQELCALFYDLLAGLDLRRTVGNC